MDCPSAYLFFNGNAVFFDILKCQIPEFQMHGWKGLHLFLEMYPNAPVYDEAGNQIPVEVLPYLLENIIYPTENKND